MSFGETILFTLQFFISPVAILFILAVIFGLTLALLPFYEGERLKIWLLTGIALVCLFLFPFILFFCISNGISPISWWLTT